MRRGSACQPRGPVGADAPAPQEQRASMSIFLPFACILLRCPPPCAFSVSLFFPAAPLSNEQDGGRGNRPFQRGTTEGVTSRGIRASPKVGNGEIYIPTRRPAHHSAGSRQAEPSFSIQKSTCAEKAWIGRALQGGPACFAGRGSGGRSSPDRSGLPRDGEQAVFIAAYSRSGSHACPLPRKMRCNRDQSDQFTPKLAVQS